MKIGIDLGTTNSALAFIDPREAPQERIRSFTVAAQKPLRICARERAFDAPAFATWYCGQRGSQPS
jgi:hypothetical protein